MQIFIIRWSPDSPEICLILPVYFLSFFKAPADIISSIEFIFNRFFFWVGRAWWGLYKISWAGWNTVCLPNEVGGLGVRRLHEFNISLLGKWWWRMLVDRDDLWYRVLKARYGEEGGRLIEGGRDCSMWWRIMHSIRAGGGGGGGGGGGLG